MPASQANEVVATNNVCARLLALSTAALLSISMAACGGNDRAAATDTTAQTDTHRSALVLAEQSPGGSPTTKTTTSIRNLIDLDVVWSAWDGNSSRVIFENGHLSIAGDPQADVVMGVHRYQTPLREGFTYSLSLEDLDTAGAAAIIFPFGSDGTIFEVAGPGQLAVATPGTPVSFVAPRGVYGFWIQVQNAWGNGGADATLHPEVDLADVPLTPPVVEQELIDMRGPWTDWQERAIVDTLIYDAAADELVTNFGFGYPPGVKFFTGIPISGPHLFTLESDRPVTTASVYFVNGVGEPKLSFGYLRLQTFDETPGRPGHYRTQGIVTPGPGANGFVIQVQGSYQFLNQLTRLKVSLVKQARQ